LELEKQLAEFLNVEEVAVYPQGFVVMSTAIIAYAKRGDVIFW
jgi:7-keto-8-aminopelargonate synthetase-like enzyme